MASLSIDEKCTPAAVYNGIDHESEEGKEGVINDSGVDISYPTPPPGAGVAATPRILGSSRTLDDVFLSYSSTSREEGLAVVKKVCGLQGRKAGGTELPLFDLEKGIRVFANRNSAYVDVEEQDFAILVEEVLNNSILSVLVFANYSPRIGDCEICALSKAMEYNVSLEALTLSGLDISDDAFSVLCQSLIHSRVSFLDFSYSSVEDSGGLSIAALAHMNPYLRTVVVTGTLIGEDIRDEIDVACQFNHSNFESNGSTTVEESLLSRTSQSLSSNTQGEVIAYDANQLKRKIVQVMRIKEKQVVLCVARLFGCCPEGELCLYSHDLNFSTFGIEDVTISQAFQRILGSTENWEDALIPLPQPGASWRGQDDERASASRDSVGGYMGGTKELGEKRGGGERRSVAGKILAKRQAEEERRRKKQKEALVYYRMWVASMIGMAGSVGIMLWYLWRIRHL